MIVGPDKLTEDDDFVDNNTWTVERLTQDFVVAQSFSTFHTEVATNHILVNYISNEPIMDDWAYSRIQWTLAREGELERNAIDSLRR